MKITIELNDTIKFLVSGLHTIVNNYNGYDIISLAKKGKLSSIIITDDKITYNEKDYNMKGYGTRDKQFLELQNNIIADFK